MLLPFNSTIVFIGGKQQRRLEIGDYEVRC